METLEIIMRESLQSQYKIKLLLAVLNIIDSAYDEDEEILLKAIVSVFKVYLNSLYNDINNTINKMDLLLTEES